MWVNFPVTDAHHCCPGVVLILFYCRWSEVTRRLELWIQILEINENGDFVPVEVIPARDVRTGGIFQLRQVGISPNTFTVNWVTATNLIFKKPAFVYSHYFQTNILSSKHMSCCTSSSPGPVEKNPGGSAVSSGLGHHASYSRNTAGSVSGLCGDQKHHRKPGRRRDGQLSGRPV